MAKGGQRLSVGVARAPRASRRGARTRSLEAHVRDHYGALPESERKIADLILDFPGQIAAYSATELAQLSGASKAAVTRLVRRLGFESFEDARRAARDAQSWGSPVYLLHKEDRKQDFAGRVEAHIAQDMDVIRRTFEGLGEGQFDAIVEAICGARRIWLFGLRNSRYLAGYLRYQLMQVRGDVHRLPEAGETLPEYIVDLEKDDLFVVIGFRRRMPEVHRALDAARGTGVKTLLITDPTSRSESGASWTVRCETRAADVFDRYAGAMSFLHFLSVAVVVKAGGQGRKRLAAIEALHEDFEDFG